MNKKMGILIICAVFALLISCKNYASSEDLKNLEQNVKGKVKGFLEAKEKIVSDDPIVYKIAEKLKEEEVKSKKDQKENKQEDKEELMQGNDPNSDSNMPALKTARDSGGQQREEEKDKVVEQKVEQAEVKAKKEEQEQERKAKEKEEQQEREKEIEKQKQQQEQQKKKQEKEKEQQQEQEERRVKSKIETLTKKIDEINRDIDAIKYKRWFVEDERRLEVKATEVRDKVTGPIYDHFTDGDKAIYGTWELLEEDEEELEKLLKELSKTRSDLRTKLNVGNQAVTWNNEPELKENVTVSEIESDLDKLKSELEKVKKYLENKSNFETIKEYVTSSDDK